MKKATIVNLIVNMLGIDRIEAEGVADDMIRNDFPKNGIKTIGGVIAFLAYVQSLRVTN